MSLRTVNDNTETTEAEREYRVEEAKQWFFAVRDRGYPFDKLDLRVQAIIKVMLPLWDDHYQHLQELREIHVQHMRTQAAINEKAFDWRESWSDPCA